MSDRIITGGRPMGKTEQSWCKAVSCGTGTTVLSLLLSKPLNITHLHNALQNLQNSHPILASKITYSSAAGAAAFSLIIPSTPVPPFKLNSFPLSSTSKLLPTSNNAVSLSHLHIIHEHEMNINPWSIPNLSSTSSSSGVPVFFGSLYELPEGKCAVVFRLHTAVCDRTTAVGVLRELKELMKEVEMENSCFGKVSLVIEDLVPVGKAKKAIWAHGLDILGYSVNSLRFTNLKFKDVSEPRCSQVVRLQLSKQDTSQILADCKLRGIKLCGALAAAGVMAAQSGQRNSGDPLQYKQNSVGNKYAIVTLTDCRTDLEPPLSSHNFGFYHSAIMTMHVVKRGETVWDLAERIYTSLSNSKLSNKHFTDMSDLNFLMCKAIENPSLTPHSSLRTSLMCVFEDTVVDNSESQFGLEDFIGCASTHGVGPSIAVFDTIRDGKLDIVFVYPSPLHSREQMGRMVEEMKRVLVEGRT
ncbi:uncharacterized protein LOC124940125 [Impatiens glandulifera]|uniref:uncharacterized protein LOC124940125 n=1 Tax=Impatiens glandulifera TaxID=253017 RepID=UPI001FB0F3E3|nr:uncharacterized protein LOC124940125 [Impatiens glandulifera]